jgi:membrane protein DedA with SNARE-associated domain
VASAAPDPGSVEARPGSAEGRLLRLHDWVVLHWPATWRRRVGAAVAVIAMLLATAIASARLLRLVFDQLDVLAYAGLFITCWLGAGGALVPIPGVRWMSFLMIINQAAAMDPVTVAVVGATAMVCGQTSWFLAARAGSQRVRAHHEAAPAAVDAAPAPSRSSADPMPPPAPPGGQPATGQISAAAGSEAAVASAAPAVGRRARLAARTARARQRTEARLREHALSTIWLVAMVPSPLTSITTSSAGAIGVPFRRFLAGAFGGFLTLSAVLALLGAAVVSLGRALL